MFWIIIAIALTVVVGIIIVIANWGNFLYKSDAIGILFGIIPASIVTGFLGAILAIVVGALGDYSPPETVHSSQEIVNIADNSAISGGLLYVSSSNVYSYYIENEDGSFELESKVASDSFIYEEDDGIPRVEEICSKTEWGDWAFHISGLCHYNFYVPSGSIVRDFEFPGRS